MQTDLSLTELLQLPAVERERSYPTRGMTPRLKVLAASLLALALVAVTIAGIAILLTRPTVPNVMTLDVEHARRVAREAGFDLVVSATLYSVAPPNTVIGQSPDAGVEPFLRRSVRVVLSSGTQAITVPDLSGESELRARSVLEQLGLNAQVVYEYAPDEIGRVVATNPEAHATVQTGDVIIVRVGAPRSQVSLVEYDLQSSHIVIAVKNDETTAITHDIALRLSSLLEAAQATVTIQDDPGGDADITLWLTTADHPVEAIAIQSDDTLRGLDGQALSERILTQLEEIPLTVTYAHIDWKTDEVPLGTVEVSFGTQGDAVLYKDTRWKDNVARSLYLAIGKTLVR